MKRYEVFYKDVKIGLLEINNEGQHKYTPNVEETEKVKENISIFYELLTKSDWRDPIPFFENRIKDALRFSNGDIIENQTDSFKMVKINNS